MLENPKLADISNVPVTWAIIPLKIGVFVRLDTVFNSINIIWFSAGPIFIIEYCLIRPSKLAVFLRDGPVADRIKPVRIN